MASFFFFLGTANAANQVVTSNSDSGAGTLRQAIADVGDGETITFNLSSGNETITLSSAFGTIWDKSVTINGDNTAGSGTNVTVQVTTPKVSTYRVFYLRPDAGKTITLQNMNIQGGATSDGGGAIKIESCSGDVVIDNCTISNSKSTRGAGIDAWGMGNLTVSNSTFSGNEITDTTYGGGGIFARSVTSLTVTSSTFDSNTGTGNGGGIYTFDETITVDKCSFTNNNIQRSGGGIYMDGDNALAASNITNSTFANNTANGSAGNDFGGGIYFYYGKHRITNCTFFNNTSQIGGGLGFSYATVYLTNTTIANNTASLGDGLYQGSSTTLYMKNSLLANNTTNDYYFGGTVYDNGYNIVEVSSGYTWSGTGNITGNQANLYLSSSLADNSTLYGTQTLAITASSVAVDAGSSGTNGIVTVPSTDQRGNPRNGTVDIGAFEYGTDTTNPTVSTLSPADNATGVSVSANLVITFDENVDRETGNIVIKKTSDDSTVETIDVTSGQVTGTGTTTITINPASNFSELTEYYVQIASTAFDDASGNSYAGITDTTSWSFTTQDATAPVISSISVTPSDDGATITWTTDEASSTQIEYGLTTSYGTSTTESDTGTRVTSHSDTLSSLNTCTTYHYRVKSTDASTNQAVSSDGTFTTTGCVGSAEVEAEAEQTITKASGGTFSLTSGTANLNLQVPVNYSSSASAEFQLHQINSSSVLTTTSTPTTQKSVVGTHTYSLLALTDLSATITTFDNPLTLTVTYTDDEVSSLIESTLEIYRWTGSAWTALSNCSVDTDANTVSCETSHFSTFGVFGDSQSSGGGGETTCSNQAQILSFSPRKLDEENTEISFSVAPTHGALIWRDTSFVKSQIMLSIDGEELPKGDWQISRGEEAFTTIVTVPLANYMEAKSKLFLDMLIGGEPDIADCRFVKSYELDIEIEVEVAEDEQATNGHDELVENADPEDLPNVPVLVSRPADSFTDTIGHWAEDDIRALRLRGVVSGKTRGKYGPDDSLTRGELTKIALTSFALGLDSEYAPNKFKDVSAGQWFHPYVMTAMRRNVIQGYPDGSFRAGNTVSRAEALKIILEMSGLDLSTPSQKLVDVPVGTWFEKYSDFAVANNMIEINKGFFMPAKAITRAEIAKVIVDVWKMMALK